MWIWKTCALEKIHFHTSLETANRQNESLVSEDCSVPFPPFSDLRFSVVNDLTKLGHRFATPVGKLRNLTVDKFGWIHFTQLRGFRYMNASTTFLNSARKSILVDGRQRELVTPIYANIGQSLRY